MADNSKIYPRNGDTSTVYLKNVVNNSNILVGDYTIYNDPKSDPRDFVKNNVFYHIPFIGDKIVIGKFCSIACGAKFLMNVGNHTLKSLSTYPFPIFNDEWNSGLPSKEAWDQHGDIVIGNDVWIGFEAVILSGVTIGDGSIIGTRSLVTKDVPPYTIVGGTPAKPIRLRFSEEIINQIQSIKWWDWPADKIAANIKAIQSGDIEALLKQGLS